MDPTLLHDAVARLPGGRWAVGVSGGADSVALLLLLRDRPDLWLHVVHLDHETRGGESATDAAFVRDLAALLNLPCTVQRRSVVESSRQSLAKNASSRYRQARLELFRQVVAAQNLDGVVLAHHADDQAETVLMRVLRGAGLSNLAGMQPVSVVGGLKITRPLLAITARCLREFLIARGQIWREDASNQSDEYQRNRVRRLLADQPQLRDRLLRLGTGSESLRQWLDATAPVLEPSFAVEILANLPPPLARHAAARWLIARGSPPTEINTRTCDRLIAMATDAASPPRQNFPGGMLVRRKQNCISTQCVCIRGCIVVATNIDG
jgi:tRNA(Ile)-lysidine synthase